VAEVGYAINLDGGVAFWVQFVLEFGVRSAGFVSSVLFSGFFVGGVLLFSFILVSRL